MEAAQLLKGVLPALTLAVIAAGDTYGYSVVRELRSRGLDNVGDASVYGTLQRLYDAGQVSSYVVPSEAGPSRRYYALTGAGRAALKLAHEDWTRFHSVVTTLFDVVLAS